MSQTPLEAAVLRLERAIRRLEQRPPVAAPAIPVAIPENASLAARHQSLRERVADAIRQLDEIVAAEAG